MSNYIQCKAPLSKDPLTQVLGTTNERVNFLWSNWNETSQIMKLLKQNSKDIGN